jgi:hypothetical protein
MTVSTSSADSVRESPTLRNTDSAKSARVTVFPAMIPAQLPIYLTNAVKSILLGD